VLGLLGSDISTDTSIEDWKSSDRDLNTLRERISKPSAWQWLKAEEVNRYVYLKDIKVYSPQISYW
jgi:hypothetical protein